MPRVLTNGKIKIGAYQFSDRKRPSLCVEEGNSIIVVGSFHDTEQANWFMDKLAECIGCPHIDPSEFVLPPHKTLNIRKKPDKVFSYKEAQK